MPIDYSRYPPHWKTETVPAVLERAGNQCENCGLENGAEVHSVPIKIYHNGRYQIRRVWISSESDLTRLKPLAYVNNSDCVIKTVRVVLSVAHLDHDEENHAVSSDRLRAWCQSCHLAYDAAEKYRRKCIK